MGTVSESVIQVGEFANPNVTAHTTHFISSWEEVQYEKVLDIIYEEDGYLSAIRLTQNGKISTFGVMPPDTEISRVHTINLQSGQWIEGFEVMIGDPIENRVQGPTGIVNVDVWIYGAPIELGDYRLSKALHRLFVPAENRTIVGLHGSSKGKRIDEFGLIERNGLQGFTPRPIGDRFTQSLAWLGGLPPRNVRVLNDCYQALKPEQLRMLKLEGMFFGTDKAHQGTPTAAAQITKISASADAGLVEMTYHDAPKKSIGKRIEMSLKSVAIDGPGGEFIVSLLLSPRPAKDAAFEWFVPGWFGIITNRGKQTIFGDQASIAKAELVNAPAGYGIVGLFLSHAFMDRWTVGALAVPVADLAVAAPSPTIQITRDERGRIWDPEAPPSNWKLNGSCVGHRDLAWDFDQSHELNETATFLDLSQRIVCIRGLLAAPDWCHIDELGGFEVRYANGSTQSIGLHLSPDKIPISENVGYEDFRAGIRHIPASGPREDGSTVHVTNKQKVEQQNRGGMEWHTGGSSGSRIVAVHVWGSDYLQGLQFETDDGSHSPKWGKAGGSPSTTFLVGDHKEHKWHHFASKQVKKVIGLKFTVRKASGRALETPGPVTVQAYV